MIRTVRHLVSVEEVELMSDDRSRSITCARRRAPRRPRPASVVARAARGQDRRSRHQGHQGPQERVPPASRAARCRCTCGCRSSRASATGSGSSTRSSTSATSARLFPDGGEIGPEELVAAGAVRRKKLVKVLGDGELSVVTLTVSAHRVLRQRRARRSRPRAAPSTSCNAPARRGTRAACGVYASAPPVRARAAVTVDVRHGPSSARHRSHRAVHRRISECSAHSGRL